MAAAALASHKRPAPEEASPVEAGKNKRPRYQLEDIDDYEMLEEIGEGVFGVVAKARDRRTREIVAVKWFRGDGEDRATVMLPAVMIEAGCLAACRGHPGVVQLRSVATDEATGDLYIVMELVAGPSLRSHLTTRRPFSEDETRDSMRQLLRVAEKLHAKGMIHRNINPDNILVGPDGALKVCGFGCTTPEKCVWKLCPEKPAWTLQYCAPEQLIGFGCYGPKADVWALGCVMAELLTGEPLLTATTEDEMIEQMEDVHDEFDNMGVEEAFEEIDLSLAGREVLAGLLAFDSDERLTAADALKHRWFTEVDVEAKPPAAVEEESLCPCSQNHS
ncbi:hypothetical protein SETIT_1G135400v2 [Setaria italica]|uniref:[RNA-polymerase]-subunit kinase n=2 Tax=Setaria italica TaxID=4555 RepID=A0A368PKA0_SETIT|nr:putative cyclin-dependent kinase F-2 [Setaria italica]RCV06082.1 hypothetical protein SETIT_1G135400v2 [Setaria italica]